MCHYCDIDPSIREKKLSKSMTISLSSFFLFLFFFLLLIANSLNDLTCASTSTTPNDETIWRTATDIYMFVDMSWTFREIQPMLG